LTAVRSGETRGATWSEFDLAEKIWLIPEARTKTGKPHRVPLSDRVVEIVSDMKRRSINQYVFPAMRGNRQLPKMALADALKAAGGTGFTVHGFRSGFRDWISEETNFQREVAEAALGHVVGDAVERLSSWRCASEAAGSYAGMGELLPSQRCRRERGCTPAGRMTREPPTDEEFESALRQLELHHIPERLSTIEAWAKGQGDTGNLLQRIALVRRYF
jgi:Phage integrase family